METTPVTLTAQQKKEFVEKGFVRVPAVFTRDTAALCREEIWRILATEKGVKRDDPCSWSHVKVGLDYIFTSGDGEPWSKVFTPELYSALDAVLGNGRSVPCSL